MRKSVALLISLFLIAADQLSKWSVAELLLRPKIEGAGPPKGFMEWYAAPPPRLPFAETEITSFFNLVIVWNKGISFGLFNQDADYGPWILIGLSLAITAIFLVLLLRGPSSRLQSLGIALIIGGALGNVIDRFRFGAVFDFLDFHLGDYHWPAFNIGDSCICIGVAALVVQTIFFEKPLHAKA